MLILTSSMVPRLHWHRGTWPLDDMHFILLMLQPTNAVPARLKTAAPMDVMVDRAHLQFSISLIASEARTQHSHVG